MVYKVIKSSKQFTICDDLQKIKTCFTDSIIEETTMDICEADYFDVQSYVSTMLTTLYGNYTNKDTFLEKVKSNIFENLEVVYNYITDTYGNIKIKFFNKEIECDFYTSSENLDIVIGDVPF